MMMEKCVSEKRNFYFELPINAWRNAFVSYATPGSSFFNAVANPRRTWLAVRNSASSSCLVVIGNWSNQVSNFKDIFLNTFFI